MKLKFKRKLEMLPIQLLKTKTAFKKNTYENDKYKTRSLKC